MSAPTPVTHLTTPKRRKMLDKHTARARAEAMFKCSSKVNGPAQAREEDQARSRAVAEKTKRLRELRLAKEAAQAKCT